MTGEQPEEGAERNCWVLFWGLFIFMSCCCSWIKCKWLFFLLIISSPVIFHRVVITSLWHFYLGYLYSLKIWELTSVVRDASLNVSHTGILSIFELHKLVDWVGCGVAWCEKLINPFTTYLGKLGMGTCWQGNLL